MAYSFLRLFGKGRGGSACANFVLRIDSNFCDSSSIITCLSPRGSIRESTKKVCGLGVALASGLVITHSAPPRASWCCRYLWYRCCFKFILMTLVLAAPMILLVSALESSIKEVL